LSNAPFFFFAQAFFALALAPIVLALDIFGLSTLVLIYGV